MTGVQTCALPINDTAYEIVKSDWSSDVCSSDLLFRSMILSVGYRVNSKRGIAFRKWANNVLKQYIMKGYAINEKRLQALEKIIDIQSRMLADALDIEELLDS